MLMEAAKPGVTTGELDRIAEESIRSMGGVPTFIGYHGYPSSICTSVNDEVVHGMPGDRALQNGDLLSIDIGTTLEGYVSDSAVTVAIGERQRGREAPDARHPGVPDARDRADAGRQPPRRHRPRRPAHAESHGYGVVRALVGHGIGRKMHEEPQVPNYGTPGQGTLLRNGSGPGDRADDHRRRPGKSKPSRTAGRSSPRMVN